MRKHPIGQMVLAVIICAAVFIPLFMWINAGTEAEQAKKNAPSSTYFVEKC